VKNHGVPEELQQSILEKAEQFFQLPREEKYKIHMSKGGKAWRGYFEVGE
jgi:isopenicillin N synthase-like dioxygenase